MTPAARVGLTVAAAALVASGAVAGARAPVVGAATASGATGAGAPAPATPGVSLVTQPPWVATGGSEVLALHLDEPPLATSPDAAVEISVHGSVTSRSDFDRAVDAGELGGTISRLTIPLSSLTVNRRGDFLVGFGLGTSDAPRRVAVDSPGVYPVEIGIVGAASDHTTFVTWMVVVDEAQAAGLQPLHVSWIWRVEAGPVEQPGGGADPSALDSMRRGGRLDKVAALLARAGSFPLTLGLGPETLASWSAAADAQPAIATGIERVRRAAARSTTQILPEPFVPIEGPTIEAEALGGHLPEEYVAGSNAIEQVTGQIPDPRTAFVDPVDDATVRRLTQMLVGRFVVRDTALTPVEESRTPAQPFTLTTSSGSAPAVATDSGLERLLASPGPPALRAQRVLAALAEIAYEAPSQARGIVLAMPRDWSPDVATVSLLLRDLARDPLVEPATLDTLFADVAPAQTDGGALQRQLAPLPAPAPALLDPGDYDEARSQLAAYAAMVGRRDPSVAAGRRALLLSLSTAITPSVASEYLGTVSARLDGLRRGISTTAKTITLTARRASLPLSFQNSTGRAGVRVRVHLDSPKLIFPNGPDVVLTLPLGHWTARANQFPVEARASGTFAMTITLESADGSFQLGPPTRVTIRSAVFSGIGIALTLGALVFLAGWWGNHFWRTRRARRRAVP